MDGATASVSITIEARLLQPPTPAALIDRHHAVRFRMQEASLDGAGGGTASEKSHGAFKIAKNGGEFRRPLLRIPSLIAQVSGMWQEFPSVYV